MFISSPSELDYLAGFFEGDGSACLSRKGFKPRISVSQRQRQPLEEFQTFFGRGHITVSSRGSMIWEVRKKEDIEPVAASLGSRSFTNKREKLKLLTKIANLRTYVGGRIGKDWEKIERLALRFSALSESTHRIKSPSLSLLAGFVDADGSFLRRKGYPHYLRLSIFQRDYSTLKYLKREAGDVGGGIHKVKNRNLYVLQIQDQLFLRKLNQYLKIKRVKKIVSSH